MPGVYASGQRKCATGTEVPHNRTLAHDLRILTRGKGGVTGVEQLFRKIGVRSVLLSAFQVGYGYDVVSRRQSVAKKRIRPAVERAFVEQDIETDQPGTREAFDHRREMLTWYGRAIRKVRLLLDGDENDFSGPLCLWSPKEKAPIDGATFERLYRTDESR